MPHRNHLALALALSVTLFSTAANADQLDQIKQAGRITCGTIGVVPAFSFQDPKTRQTVGYDIDICEAVAAQLGVKADFKLVSGPARIPELNQGNFDIIVSTLGWSEDRARQVAYSNSYIVNKMVVGVRRDKGISTLAELRGKRISTQSGSTSGQALQKVVPEVELLNFEDVPQAFLAVNQNKAVGITITESMLRKLSAATVGKPSEIRILSDEPVLIEYNGIGVRKSEPRLLEAVNKALGEIEKSGQLDRIFDKWLGKDSEFHLQRNFKVEPIPVDKAGKPPQLG